MDLDINKDIADANEGVNLGIGIDITDTNSNKGVDNPGLGTADAD